MRIALHLPDLAGGGAERMIVHLANEFAFRGHHVALVVNDWTGPLTGLVSRSVERCVLGPQLDPAPFSCDVAWSAVALRFAQSCSLGLRTARLAVWIDVWRPHVVLATLSGAISRALFAGLLARGRIRTVVREANLLFAVGPFGRSRTQSFSNMLLSRLAYRRADHVIAVGADVRSQLITMYGLDPALVTALPNPTIPAAFVSTLSGPAPHPALASRRPRPVPVIVVAGRLYPQKGFSVLLRALALLRPSCPARLLVLGTGRDRVALEDVARDLGVDGVVEFVGFQSSPASWFCRADVFVLSSWYEGWPNVLVEALASGCPVIATRCSAAVLDITAHGRHAQLVPAGDPAALSSALLAVLRGSPRSLADRHAAVVHARRFTVAAGADAYLRVLLPSSRV